MIEIDIVGGCQRDDGRPCRQGDLDGRGVELVTTAKQLQDGNIDLEDNPSGLIDIVLEKAMQGGGAYTCAYCDAKVNIIVDSKAYMSLMDSVGDSMDEEENFGAPDPPSGPPEPSERGSSLGSGPSEQGRNVQYQSGPAPQPPSSDEPIGDDPSEEGRSVDLPDENDEDEGLPPHLKNLNV